MTDDIVARLRGAADESIGCNCVKCEAADEIERLRKERNEARREILESLHPDLRKSYAAARCWDCCKENSDEQ
jgi:hypothetical protein